MVSIRVFGARTWARPPPWLRGAAHEGRGLETCAAFAVFWGILARSKPATPAAKPSVDFRKPSTAVSSDKKAALSEVIELQRVYIENRGNNAVQYIRFTGPLETAVS